MMQPLQQEHKLQQVISSLKGQLEQMLSCHICYEKVRNATMCPYCSKLYCQSCIRRCMQAKQQCPNCRKSLKTVPITNCSRFITQINRVVQQLIEHKSHDEKCIAHNVVQNYYCQQCTLPICCECEMFGQHKGHQIQQIKKVYDQKCQKVKEQLNLLRKSIRSKEGQVKEVQQKVVELKREKDRRLTEIQQLTQFYRLKILNEIASEDKFLRQYSQLISEEVMRVEELEKAMKKKLANPHKLSELTQAEQDEIRDVCHKEFVSPNADQKLNFIQELIPPYEYCEFVVENFSKLREEKEIVYSPILEQEGLQWRLKIYPNGNESADGTHLSVFLELVASIRNENLYEYQIELINQRCPEHRKIREYSSSFDQGECWGYNKYIELQILIQEGFIEPSNDSIKMRFYVREPSYYQVSEHKAAFCNHLDKELLRQEEEIKQLEEMLANQKS